MFTATFEEGKGDELLGGAPDPEHDNDENIISVFINKVINPDKPFGSSVSVYVMCSWTYNYTFVSQTRPLFKTKRDIPYVQSCMFESRYSSVSESIFLE